jgi:hypothetical protein
VKSYPAGPHPETADTFYLDAKGPVIGM